MSPAAVNAWLKNGGDGVIIEKGADNNESQQSDEIVDIERRKKDVRNWVEVYLQQSLMCLKYEHAVAKAKMTEVLSSTSSFADAKNRGTKRHLEQKKFNLLGKIQLIKSIFTVMMDQNWDLKLVQGDMLYQNIYHQVACLYKSDIDQRFLINFLKLKNQKRESNRLINFIEGAYRQALKITQNEMLNYDPDQVGIP